MDSEKLLRAIWQVSDEKVAESETNELEFKEVTMIKRVMGFKPLKIAAAGVAAALVLTIGVGAFNGWDYGGLFAMLFGGYDIELDGLGHMIEPEVSNKTYYTDELEVEILGIIGDDRAFYTLIEVTHKSGCIAHMWNRQDVNSWNYYFNLHKFTPERTGVVEDVNGMSSLTILSREQDRVIMAAMFDFDETLLEKGYAHITLNTSPWDAEMEKLVSFDILVDYEFTAARVLPVTEINGASAEIEITPIAVRISLENNNPSYNGFALDLLCGMKLTFNDGRTISFNDNSFGGSGGESCGIVFFRNPVDLDELAYVTVGGVRIDLN
jgi:hypothetical protein